MAKYIGKKQRLDRRHRRIRRKIAGTPDCPRLCVSFTGKHIQLQVVNDDAEMTIVSASTLEPEIRGKGLKANLAGAEELGKTLAERALEKGIKQIVFDRGGFNYHGRVKAIADAARKTGLQF